MNLCAALITAGVQPDMADTLCVPFAPMLRANIWTPRTLAASLANLSHESQQFTRTTENLYYTTEAAMVRAFGARMKGRTELLRNPEALANAAYANRLGNGDEASGDGWKYRGRGYIQLTGRYNYVQAARALSTRYDANPDQVAQAEGAIATSVWFWTTRGCSALAEQWNLDALRERINGPAKLGAKEVATLAAKILRTLETA
jgi:putative chitinase